MQVSGQALAVLLMRNVRMRTELLEIGLAAGLAYAAMTVASALLTMQA